jgi:Cys-tRNA(Pro) deacylase
VKRSTGTTPANSYGEETADALGVDPARVFKTLLAQVDGGLAVAVPVPARLDLEALAAALGAMRAALADPAVAKRATGYVVGGISPFGQRRRLPTVVDTSALTAPCWSPAAAAASTSRWRPATSSGSARPEPRR